MNWKVKQSRRFARAYKKLNNQVANDVNKAVLNISQNPSIGQEKKGDLAALNVYKFHSQNQQYLLGYTLEETPKLIYLEAVGPHENFYQKLKRN